MAAARVLHLHSAFDTGGKELRCVQLINAFGDEFAHTIISAQPGALAAADLIFSTISVDYPKEFPSLIGRPMPGRLRRIAQAMMPYDLILSYNWGAMDGVMAHRLFSRMLGLPPLIHHEDGFNADEAVKLKAGRNYYRRLALGCAAALVVPSRKLERIALDQWHQPRSKVQHIANGIDTAAFEREAAADALPQLHKQPGQFWVGTLAGLRKVKNLDLLVRLAGDLPDDWHLVILGEGPERAALEAGAQALGIAHRVHLPGFVAQPAKVVGLFDIFALSSYSEQFPISVVEAMAAAIPVVAPAVGDIAQMVGAQNADFITPAGDEQSLRAALQQLAGDAALRLAVGQENRLKAQNSFDERAMIGRYRALYTGVITKNITPGVTV